jgi:hypothetical protein
MATALVQPTVPSPSRRVPQTVAQPASSVDAPATSVVAGRQGATEFSLALNDDQLQIQAWVHDLPRT